MKIHIVKPGDTLYKLSQTYNVSLEKLIAANPQIVNPDNIDVGMKVKIPLKAIEPIFQNQNPPPPSNIQQPIIVTPKPVENIVKPAELPSKPVENIVKPAELPPKPVENIVKPAELPPKPVENIVKPAELPPKPVEKIVKPAELPPKSAQPGLKSPGYYEHPLEKAAQAMGSMKESMNYTPYPSIEEESHNLFAQFNIPAVEAYSDANYNTAASCPCCGKPSFPMQPSLYPYTDSSHYNPYNTNLMSLPYSSPIPGPNLSVYPYPFSAMASQGNIPHCYPMSVNPYGAPYERGYDYPGTLGSSIPEMPAESAYRETDTMEKIEKESEEDEKAFANNHPKKKPVKHMGAQEALQKAANRMSRNRTKRKVKQENLPWMTV